MLETIAFEFEKHINFVLDAFEEASCYSWPGITRSEKARLLDYEYFKHIDTMENQIKVLSENEEFIGFLWCSIGFNKIEERKYCHTKFIYITPKHRKKGNGQFLLEKAEDIASENEASIISLEVTVGNTSAVHLYEKKGYQKRRYTMQKEL